MSAGPPWTLLVEQASIHAARDEADIPGSDYSAFERLDKKLSEATDDVVEWTRSDLAAWQERARVLVEAYGIAERDASSARILAMQGEGPSPITGRALTETRAKLWAHLGITPDGGR